MDGGRMGEGHEVVLVVAPNLKEAKVRALAKWSGGGRGHFSRSRWWTASRSR